MFITLKEWLRLASLIFSNQENLVCVSKQEAEQIYEICGFHIIDEMYKAGDKFVGYQIEILNSKTYIIAKLKYGITEHAY